MLLLKSAAMDGRFLIFAIKDDRKNNGTKKDARGVFAMAPRSVQFRRS